MRDIVLGIDPGLHCTGWGILHIQQECIYYLSSGAVMTDKASASLGHRLLRIANEIEYVIKKFSPTVVSIEKMFINSNNNASMKLGMVIGVIFFICAKNNLPIREYATTEIKKNVSGNGRAEKEQIYTISAALCRDQKLLLRNVKEKKLYKIYFDNQVIDNIVFGKDTEYDALDAISVAICHCFNIYRENYVPV